MDAVDLTTEAGQNVLIVEIFGIAHRLARRWLRGRRHDAEDVGQDVVLHCLEQLRACQWDIGDRTLEAHIGCLVRRRIIALRRARRRWMERDLEHARDLESSVRVWMEPDTAFEAAELHELYEATLRSLPPTCRKTYELVRSGGMTRVEAAERLGVTTDAVGAHVLRAHKAFQTAMETRGFSPRRRGARGREVRSA